MWLVCRRNCFGLSGFEEDQGCDQDDDHGDSCSDNDGQKARVAFALLGVGVVS